jgi:signal transduction histidine kinase/ActR/RegA family two-component response regulator
LKLQAHLFRLVIAVVIPLVVLAILAGAYAVRNERESAEQSAGRIARAAMSAVDAEIRGSMSTIEALSSSEALVRGDIRAFHAEAQRVLSTQPIWFNIGLASPNKVQLFDARLPYGEHRPFGVDQPSFDRAVSTGKPVVGDMAIDRIAEKPIARIRYPIVQGGEVRYVLSVSLSTTVFDRILREQSLPDGWVIVIADRNRRFVARLPYQPAGAPVSPDFRRALDQAPEGFIRGRTVEGFETYTPYLTSAYSGWTLGVAIPRNVIDAGMWRIIWSLTAGITIALLLAFLLAWFMARTVTRSVSVLAGSTDAVGRGETLPAEPPARIDEIAVLHRSLREASIAVRQRDEASQRERQALEREKDALSRVDRAKDEFLAMLSHELRNPLAGLTAAAHILQLSRDHSNVDIASKAIGRQTKQMSRLVEELLDMSSVAMGKTVLHKEVVDLAKLVNHCVENWRTSGQLNKHRLNVDSQSVCINADRARMEQIVSNLLDNAVKFTPAGGTISVEVKQHEGLALLAVQDTGRGFSPEVADELFQMFYQVDAGGARTDGGMGIGLALVKRLVEMHGGSVTATSPGPNAGARFTVTIPAVQAMPAAENNRAMNGSKARILIVDDNTDARETLATLLSVMGYNVMQAPSGAQALHTVEMTPPDVVLLDIGMPEMDGYEVARRLRRTPDGQRLVLIAVSGYGQIADKDAAKQAGFDMHLTKPVDGEALEQTLSSISSLGSMTD